MIPHDLTRRVECMWGIMMLTFDMTFQAPTHTTETLSYLKKKKTAKEPVPSVRNGPHGLNSWHPRGNSTRVSNPWSLYQSLSLSLCVWWDTFIANCRLVSERFCSSALKDGRLFVVFIVYMGTDSHVPLTYTRAHTQPRVIGMGRFIKNRDRSLSHVPSIKVSLIPFAFPSSAIVIDPSYSFSLSFGLFLFSAFKDSTALTAVKI